MPAVPGSVDFAGASLELTNAFAPVKATLRELTLDSYVYPELLLSSVISLRGLTRLELQMRQQMWHGYTGQPMPFSLDGENTHRKVSFGRAVGMLESLPNLRELKLTEDENSGSLVCDGDSNAGFMLGCSRIKSLRVLNSDYLHDWKFNESCDEAFATMMASLERLEELSTVANATARFWQKVAERGGGTRLKKLLCEYSEVEEVEDLTSLVHCILHQFSSLTSVGIALENHFHLPGALEETLQLLAPLREHPRLTNIKFYVYDCNRGEVDWESGVTRLQELVGSGIHVEPFND